MSSEIIAQVPEAYGTGIMPFQGLSSRAVARSTRREVDAVLGRAEVAHARDQARAVLASAGPPTSASRDRAQMPARRRMAAATAMAVAMAADSPTSRSHNEKRPPKRVSAHRRPRPLPGRPHRVRVRVRASWCEREDLNFHELAFTSPSS